MTCHLRPLRSAAISTSPDRYGSPVRFPKLTVRACDDGAMTESRAAFAGYTCRICGQRHDGVPLAFGVEAPVYWSADVAATPGSALDDEICIIGGEHYFVRALIHIPVIGTADVFTWNAWVSLSADNFRRMVDNWERPGRESEPAYFGWFSNDLPGYSPSTVNLKTHVHTQPLGQRPCIELEPTDHLLAVEQRNGMSVERVRELAELALHAGT